MNSKLLSQLHEVVCVIFCQGDILSSIIFFFFSLHRKTSSKIIIRIVEESSDNYKNGADILIRVSL